MISLQKVDSLLVFLSLTGELKRFLRHNAEGFGIKIHLNPKSGISAYHLEFSNLADWKFIQNRIF